MSHETLSCKACGCKATYNKDSIQDAGTPWEPVWEIKCAVCGATIKTMKGSKAARNVDFELEPDKDEGTILRNKSIPPPRKPDALTRAKNREINEFSIQHFVQQNYSLLGFKNLDGPFYVGPDFTTRERGKKVGVEVERCWENWFLHKHHTNPAFAKVKYLIVLDDAEPPDAKARQLPKIIYIDTMTFVNWFRDSARKYYEERREYLKSIQLEMRVGLVAQLLRERYTHVCPDTDRDMAICPNCSLCAYQPEIDFSGLALQHLLEEGYPFWKEEFKIQDIKAARLNRFWSRLTR